jgi:hypothetical protein
MIDVKSKIHRAKINSIKVNMSKDAAKDIIIQWSADEVDQRFWGKILIFVLKKLNRKAKYPNKELL